MIVNKLDKGFQIRSDMPSTNWMGDDWYLVPDGSDLANKIQQLYPRFDFILEGDNLVDVIEIPKTQEEIKQERIVEIDIELEALDKKISREMEDKYTEDNLEPTVQFRKDAITRKNELRAERATLQ